MTSQLMQTLDDFSIPLLIPTQAKILAEQFAAQQPTSQRNRQVYLNTLAVCIVNNYLKIMGISTNLAAGDSWNPSVRLYADVADLEVVGRGRLECRPIPVQPGVDSTACSVPTEVQSSRIGYVMVELDLEQELGTILGFTETAKDSIARSQLRSPDDLLEHLLSSPQTQTAPASVNLRQWLQDTIATGWETVETLLFPQELSPVRGGGQKAAVLENPDSVASVIRLLKSDQPDEIRAQAAEVLGQMEVSNSTTIKALTELLETTQDEETRWQAALSLGKLDPSHDQAGVVRVKAINLSRQTPEQVALMVAITPKAKNRIGVWLQVQPLGTLDVLPAGLTLKVLSMSGETRLQAQARSDSQGQGVDQSIGHRFSPPPGVGFRVQLELGFTIVTEDFLA
ncbi:MAG: DUF1822 family protein [Cyanobacteria bacterium J06592_8]